VIILGLSYNYHDAAACIVRNGVPIAAAEEERFSRQKHDTRFPERAIAYCLHEAGIAPANLDCIAFYEKPACANWSARYGSARNMRRPPPQM